MLSVEFRKLQYATPYRFRLDGRPGSTVLPPCSEKSFLVPGRFADRTWQATTQETQVPAWEPVLGCRNEPSCLISFPFDVVCGSPAQGHFPFTRVSKWVPAPDGMETREIWKRHFAWLRMADPVHGGIADPQRMPDRLFVNLFHPEPFTGDLWSGNPEELLEAISTWQGLWVDPVPVTLLVASGVEAWKGPRVPPFSLEVAVCPDRYPAHHPGMLLSRRWHPYGFGKKQYAWTDADTLVSFHAAVQREPQAFRIPLMVTGCAKNGVLPASPWSRLDLSDLGFPADALGVSGGLLTGRAIGDAPVVYPWDRGFAALERSRGRSFLWFMHPGFRADSASFLFASRYLPNLTRELGADLRGEPRFCIACNQCGIHCPAGLDPQILWKCLRANLVEEAMASGLARCLECGLCSYTCPSKIELLDTFGQARSALRKKRSK